MSDGSEVFDASPARERAGGRVVLLVIAALAALLGAAYAGAYYAAGDRVPRGTSISGVDVGGKTEAQAVRALTSGLAGRVDRPISVTAGDYSAEIPATDAGLEVDYEASVAAAGASRSWDPAWLWSYFTGGEDIDAVVDVDEAAMSTVVAGIDKAAGSKPIEGAVTFVDGSVKVTDAEAGASLDLDAASEALRAAYLSEDGAASLDLVEVEPDIDQADVRAAVDDFANPAVSGPIEIVFGKSTVSLGPRAYTKAITLEPEGGALVPTVDYQRLNKLIKGRTGKAGAPVDATVALVGGTPQVVPAKPGVTYAEADVEEVFLSLVAAKDGERRAEVAATVAEPKFTTEDAEALGIKEKVSTFTTYYPYAEYRNINIGRAAQLVDGTVLKPGEVFSLNGIVGERTKANGFTEGFIISDGIFKEDLGGGVSQMATTTFNAMFFAGLKDIEHKPHSFYIDRYPVGREATVAWGAVDLRFQNDTPYGVLIQAGVSPSTPTSQGVVTVSMWSTKYWDISTTTSDRYNFTKPKTRTLTTEDCYPNTGYDGFDVDVTRTFRRAGESGVTKTETFHTTYIPSDTVICKAPPEPTPSPTPTTGN